MPENRVKYCDIDTCQVANIPKRELRPGITCTRLPWVDGDVYLNAEEAAVWNQIRPLTGPVRKKLRLARKALAKVDPTPDLTAGVLRGGRYVARRIAKYLSIAEVFRRCTARKRLLPDQQRDVLRAIQMTMSGASVSTKTASCRTLTPEQLAGIAHETERNMGERIKALEQEIAKLQFERAQPEE